MRRVQWVGAALAAAMPLAMASAGEVYEVGGPDSAFDLKIEVDGSLNGTGERVSDIPVDAAGTTLEARNGADGQGRLGLRVDMMLGKGKMPIFVRLDGQGDALTGQLLDLPQIQGIDLPATGKSELTIRSAHLVVGLGQLLAVQAGYMPSDWGMGLVAHGGSTDWNVEDSMFNDARGGDVVRRIVVSTGPWSDLDLTAFGFYGDVARDALMLEDDEATDAGGGIKLKTDLVAGGLYYVHRGSTHAGGKSTDVDVADVHLESSIALTDSIELKLETEAALIVGTTDLAPSVELGERDVKQFGWSGRVSLAGDGFGVVTDWLYATGDQNVDDKEQNGFRADPNFEMGLLMFRHVHAAQTGRAPITAGDPDLVGQPSADLDRLPSRGAVTNTFSVFPKAHWSPTDGVHIYGGAVLAFTDVPPADPRNTRLAGGDPRNAIGGEPGGYLGTEIDVGAHAEYTIWDTTLCLRAEYGYLMPGSAMKDAAGGTMDAVHGGRLMTQIKY